MHYDNIILRGAIPIFYWQEGVTDGCYYLFCAGFSYFDSWNETSAFNIILANCAYLCEDYGYNFQVAMLENIKEILSRTGAYDEKAKWYKADYEKARIEK